MARQWPVAVLFGHRRSSQRPVNTESWIVESNAARGVWSIERRGQIVDVRGILQSLVSVRTALWNVEHSTIFCAQLRAIPFAKRCRFRSKVDHHVENFPLCAPDQLGLKRRLGLKVHATDSSLPDAESHILLNRHEIN